MTGKCGCYRSPASTDTTFPAERSSYAQTERALLSAPTCMLTQHSSHAWAALIPHPYPPCILLLPSCSSSPLLLQGWLLLKTADSTEDSSKYRGKKYVVSMTSGYPSWLTQHGHPSRPTKERGSGWNPCPRGWMTQLPLAAPPAQTHLLKQVLSYHSRQLFWRIISLQAGAAYTNEELKDKNLDRYTRDLVKNITDPFTQQHSCFKIPTSMTPISKNKDE